ncbi:amidohydrolase family protein [Pedobacter sp. UBA4863]|uniref:N-acyl-D-amino-acid deacylase family protein n=1 Tax=Pedobacter sp. UBA4863 TaxID=1947060 RepID=UPI0025F622F7|nr:amidohydrolase family protein [Pedobacter sp. UBA4863]
MKKLCLTNLLIITAIFGAHAQKIDYLIKNGYVFDGTGADSVQQDIGIYQNKIVFIGNSNKLAQPPKKIIDAKGKYIAPGFIDPHTHIERLLDSDDKEKRAALIWLRQGVTTVLTGNDGYGKTNVGQIFSNWEKNGIGPNVAMFVGFGPVRTAVVGDMPVQPTEKQVLEMQQVVEQGMKDGAIGFSTGLSYLPQTFAKTPEIIALAKAASKYNGIYDTHMRAQSWPNSKGAIEEVLEIEKQAGIKVHISHIKSSGPIAFGKSTNILKLLDAARKQGSTIDASVYPYTASANGLRGLLPLWAREEGTEKMVKNFDDPVSLEKIKAAVAQSLIKNGGGKTQLITTRSKSMANLNGKTVAEIANMWDVPEEEVIIRILKRNPTIGVISFGMDEGDVLNFLRKPYIVVGSDGTDSHPRGAGTFAKVINEYVIQQKIMPLKEMIYKSTGLTAEKFKLKDRGVIKEGAIADIVIFDPKTYKANSTYQNPTDLATGVQAVFVNGQLVIENDVYNGSLVGKVIRYNKQE